MPLNLSEIPLRIKKLRESAGIGQSDLARMSGITQGQISHYESARAFPGLESASKIADALGITVADLLNEKEPVCAKPRPPTKEEMAMWVLVALDLSPTRLDQVRHILGLNSYKF